MNLYQFLLQQIEKSPDKIYLRFKDQQITYASLYDRVNRMAAGLERVGIQEGDTVCLMLDNCPEYLDIWFALSSLGAVKVPLNVHLKGEGLRYILDHSDCKLIIAHPQYQAKILDKLPESLRGVKIVLAGADEQGQKLLSTQSNNACPVLEWQELTATDLQPQRTCAVRGQDVNSILYTSGTTGLPKGVMLSHHAYVNAGEAFAREMIGARPGDILFTNLPLFHVNAHTTTVLGSISVNATIALEKRFSASRFWQDIRYHQATMFNALGSMITILCKQPENEDDRDNPVRLAACAATPKEFWSYFEKRFDLRIVEGYGLTETAGFCMANPLQANRPPSIGRPLSYIEMQVVNDQGEKAAPGEVGEILIRSDQPHTLMEGYYKNPEATCEAMAGGWFHSGDRGYQDEEGYFYFVDRIKQCIRRRGENISSWEIEKVVNTHPKVLESAAVGVPSELGEEDVKIFVIVREGEQLSPEELLDWCQERMAYFMVPRYVEFTNAFPKTATERIQKFKLKEMGIGNAWDREKAGYVVKRD
ncbi:crotonobetaine/carnitine-CoA ligase [Caldalkalibacillus uzonensis]|uniref:Crotonobetaine/carnitine-CoA ligase n=2 Tax=Caldalkalibacillus TaxID=379065 RepID=A0ABU0CNB7_9BACI|nr:ATP-dependent acyl-CoA ligase [Caldalkalibacillus uzonensis]MDQ0337912.1 crotonobetaine/carnitine-CoA ligase [Caldalkalibacillus uzonensis]